MSEFDFGSLLKEEPKVKEITEPKPVVPTPKPTKKIESTPTRTSRRTDLEHRIEALETQLATQDERQRLRSMVGEMDAQGLALGMLFKALKDAQAQGTLKFKPRDFRDIQHLLGPSGFKAAWDYCLTEKIVIAEHALTDAQITRLGVTKTTGGRYVCDYSRLP